jgi:hypothetical protein
MCPLGGPARLAVLTLALEFRHGQLLPQASDGFFSPLGRSVLAHYAIASKAMLSVSASAKGSNLALDFLR